MEHHERLPATADATGSPVRPPAAVAPPPAADERVRYRARTTADLPRLGEVLAAQQPRSGYPLTWPLPVPVEGFLVRRHETQAWVAEVGGRAVGHVATEEVAGYDDDIVLRWAAGAGVAAEAGSASEASEALECVSVLFVDERWRGRGIGSALLDLAVAAIRERGRTPVLDVVHQEGLAANLYRRRGWLEVGEASLSWLPAGHPPLLLMVLPGGAERASRRTSS